MIAPLSFWPTKMTIARRNSAVLFLFLINSIALQMVIGQDDSIVRFSTIYWALVLPAVALPLFAAREIIGTLLGRGIFLLAFLVCAGAYHFVRGDYQAVAQLFLLVWVLAWCACESTVVDVEALVKLLLATFFAGIAVALFTDLNPWGFFPKQTATSYGAWRTSFFPHVANSATMSLIVLMFLTKDSATAHKYAVALLLCGYFLLFGFVRTTLIAAALYLVLHAIFVMKRVRSPITLLMGAGLLTVGSLVTEFSIVPALDVMQHSPFMARFFLRGETGLSRAEIYQQLYRPWLWKEHLSIFFSSPNLMGFGNFKLLDHVSENILPGLDASGSESWPTRMLATYGLSSFFHFAYLITQLARLARSRDAWACACFPAIVFMMMNWGSVFHPTNAFFVLFMLILKGDKHAVAEASPLPGSKFLVPPAAPCLEIEH